MRIDTKKATPSRDGFDEKKEIDVSGTAKLSELDGIDESFFEFTEMDLSKFKDSDIDIRNASPKQLLEMAKKYGYVGLTRLHVSAWDKLTGV